MQGMTTTSNGSISELPCNDPTIVSFNQIFPSLAKAVVQSIYSNKFQAANLLKLETSFIDKMKHIQLYSTCMGESKFNLSTTCKDVNLEEYESISQLLR
jgi:hypothetical protein